MRGGSPLSARRGPACTLALARACDFQTVCCEICGKLCMERALGVLAASVHSPVVSRSTAQRTRVLGYVECSYWGPREAVPTFQRGACSFTPPSSFFLLPSFTPPSLLDVFAPLIHLPYSNMFHVCVLNRYLDRLTSLATTARQQEEEREERNAVDFENSIEDEDMMTPARVSTAPGSRGKRFTPGRPSSAAR